VHVLIVDDEDSLLLTLAANLELEEIEVTTAGGGARAIELAAEQHFDVVLSDMRMPGMNGLQLVGELRKINPVMPVIIMTAFALEGLVEQAISEGVFTVLRKPFDVDHAIATVKRASARPTVLVVHDDPDAAESIASVLRAARVSAMATCDAQDAIRIAREAEIDVCIAGLDLRAGAAELITQLHALDRSIACVAMSAHRGADLRRVASQVVACIAEPVQTLELLQVVAKARAAFAHAPARPGGAR
jgi:DNA-binding NtrC family response regulator